MVRLEEKFFWCWDVGSRVVGGVGGGSGQAGSAGPQHATVISCYLVVLPVGVERFVQLTLIGTLQRLVFALVACLPS